MAVAVKYLLMTTSLIPQDTIAAYEAANYRVADVEPFVLKIGEYSPELLNVYRRVGCKTSTFITAYNPFSYLTAEADNVAAQASLETKLKKCSVKLIAGFGEGAQGDWPGEPSFLAFGVSLKIAKDLGSKFGQNAIVWIPDDATPQLVLLR